jgi:hypothetical protein
VHVFGAPCMYSPPEGPVHKRAAQTLEGFFVGVQHPKALVIRKSDMKLISVSKKKLVVYESMYTVPLSYSSAKLREKIDEIGVATHTDEEAKNVRLGHVQSIKSVSAQNIPVPNTTAHRRMRPPTTLDNSANTQSPSLGEGVVVPEHSSYNEDLAEGILALKQKAESTINDPNTRKKIIDSIENLLDASSNVVSRNQLKKGKKSKMNIDVANVIEGKRIRPENAEAVVAKKRPREKHAEEGAESEPLKKKKKEKTLLPKFGLKRGDAVSVSSKVFDGDNPGSFSKSNPERQLGTVARVWAGRKIAQVEYADGSKWMHRYDQLRIEKIKMDAAFMMTIMIVNAIKAPKDPLDKEGWPRDFFHAMVSPEWREWIAAIKTEIASWLDFNAFRKYLLLTESLGPRLSLLVSFSLGREI